MTPTEIACVLLIILGSWAVDRYNNGKGHH